MTSDALFDELRAIAADPADRWRSLPPAAYCSAELFALEAEHLFYRGWVLVGRADQIPKAGDYLCFDLIDEPVVAVRDKAGRIRVLSRVCRHRWMHVCEGEGNANAFVCPYHAWTYNLDGALRHAPEMQNTPGFAVAEVRLPEFRSELWEGFIFVNISGDAAPLAETLSMAKRQLAGYRLESWVTVRSLDLGEAPWDWKVFMENGEIYHHLMLHRDKVEPRSPARLSVSDENDGGYFLLYGPAEPSILIEASDGKPMMPSYLRPVGDWVPRHLTDRQRTSAAYFYPYPNYVIALWVNIGIFFRVVPLGPGRCYLRLAYMVPGDLADHPDLEPALDQAVATFTEVHNEDAMACTAVQRGVRSRFATTASLSRLEEFNNDFDHWVARKISAALDD